MRLVRAPGALQAESPLMARHSKITADEWYCIALVLVVVGILVLSLLTK